MGATADWLMGQLQEHAQAVIFVSILLENAALPIPGELFLLGGGYLAAAGRLDPLAAAFLGATGAVLGDHVGYLAGRQGGRRLLALYCRATLGSGRCLERTEAYFRRLGPLTVALARFVVGVRLFATPLAGSAALPYHRFLLFDVAGAAVWAATFVTLGYSIGPGWAELAGRLGRAKQAVVIVGVAGVLGMVGVRLWQRSRHGAARPPAAPPAHQEEGE